jgi:leader peptidase (prepilin peptidase)/N-methyltransferase
LLAARLPEGRAVVWARSICPHCGQTLGWRELVPVLSWLLQRGACRACGRDLSWAYPAIELAAVAVAVWSLAVTPGWLAWASAGLGWSLLLMSVIDVRHLMLPDELTLPLIPAGLAVAWAVDPERLPHHVAGVLAGFLLVVVLRWAYGRVRGREGIGLGDAKLLAAAGAWVSWQALPGLVLISAGAALAGHVVWSLARGRWDLSREFPFGPFLAAGLWLTWLYGPVTIGSQ